MVLFIIIGDNTPISSKDHWSAVAIALKLAHADTYPRVNAAVGNRLEPRFLRSLEVLLTFACSRIIGAALGSIMAIIMIHHMRNITVAYVAVHSTGIAIECDRPSAIFHDVMLHTLMPVPAPAST